MEVLSQMRDGAFLFLQRREAKSPVYLFFSVLLVGLELLMLIRPDVFYEIVEGWKSSSPSGPSDFYRISTRFGGALMLAVGFGGVAVQLFL